MVSKKMDLLEFLKEAELQEYYGGLKTDLKVHNVSQLKYVEEADLIDLGMTKPEIRRLKKYYRKEFPQGALGKFKKKIMRSSSDVSGYREERPLPITISSPRRYVRQSSGSRHIIPAEQIEANSTLGVGEFGIVQQGIWTNDEGEKIQVAIKCLSKERIQTGIADFLKEATMMHTVDHENIVRLYGVVLDSSSEAPLMLVTELAPLRSLLECLKDPTMHSTLPVTTLCDYATQIAKGMEYLESRRMIHRDLAARNILVFSKTKVKISDFGMSRALGLSRDYYQTNFNVNLKLPIAWCAPECINYLRFTTASDMWAFGVTLWEMFSYGLQPWGGFSGQQENNGQTSPKPLELTTKILEAIDEPNCRHLDQPDCCPKEFYGLMLKCWENDPVRRPTFADVAAMLPQIQPCSMIAERENSNTGQDFLVYREGDLVTVLDRKPQSAPGWNLWKGAMSTNNKTGYFDPADFKQNSSKSPSPIKGKMARKESQRKSKKITPDMISKPANDLRHTGHIGYDGTMFGDVAFIGDNYDKLPLKVAGKSHSNGTSPVFNKSESPVTKSNESGLSGNSAWTISSLDSAGSDNSGSLRNGTQGKTDYSEIDGEDDFDDFKLPDLGLSTDLDFGPSFMEEMMKALNEKTTDDFSTEKKEEKKEDTWRESVHDFKENIPVSATPSRESSSEKEIRDSWGSQEELISSSSDELKNRDESDKKHGGQKRRSKLKLTPFKDDKDKTEIKTKERHSFVKQLSASDEKQLETAIAMANQIAQEQLTPKSPKSTDEDNDGNDTPSRKSKFSFKFPTKKTSPQPEKRTFSDEFARSADANQDVPPEAQEAYNLLVVRGSVKEKWNPPRKEVDPEPKRKENEEDEEDEEDRNGEGDARRGSSSAVAQPRHSHSRQQRLQRAQEHQRRTSESGESGIAAANRNLKDPQGIPSRDSTTKEDGGESVNPLRMLRAGGGGFVVPPRSSGRRQMPGRGSNADAEPPRPVPRPRYGARLNAEKKEESNSAESLGSGGSGSSGSRSSTTQKPSYFRKFQEFDDALKGNSSESDSKESIDKVGTDGSRDRPDISNPLPLPPRKPLRPSTLNQKPRERKYPLQEHDTEPRERRSQLPQPPPVPRSNGAFEREDEVFSSDQSDRSASPGTLVSKAHIAMRTVHCNDDEIGLNNNLDPFWREEVNFERLPPSGEIKYKTSDNVSYEDLMEFALDTGDSGKPCKEVEAMQKILGKQIAISDCRQALDSTQWDVATAIKYVKLKMLLSTQLGDISRCKEALRNCSWNVEQAANYLLSNPDYSPECVDV